MAGRSEIEANSLSIKETKNTLEEHISSAYKLEQCLRRRAIRYEFAKISFRTHELYIDKLFKRLRAEPPPNFQPTSLSQILRAGREVWVYLAQTVMDIRPQADGTRPMDSALNNGQADYNVAFHVLPLPHSASASIAPAKPREERAPWANARTNQYQPYRPAGKGKEGKGKANQQQVPVLRRVESRVALDATMEAGRSVSILIWVSVIWLRWVDLASNADTSDSKPIVSRHMRFALRVPPRCQGRRRCRVTTHAAKFHFGDGVALELFAGSAGVTACFQRRNFPIQLPLTSFAASIHLQAFCV